VLSKEDMSDNRSTQTNSARFHLTTVLNQGEFRPFARFLLVRRTTVMRLGLSRVRYLFPLTFLCCSLTAIGLQAQNSAATASASAQDDPLQRPRPTKKRNSSKTETPVRRWLEDEVPYIITPEERDAFKKLTNDTERENFIEQFWFRRDPTPDTEENEYKEEYYRRIAFANERFAAGAPGWKTDRGRIYIIHGAPNSIESHPAGGP
jgi:GWxTD domain-containing protein